MTRERIIEMLKNVAKGGHKPAGEEDYMIWEHDYYYWDGRDMNEDPYDPYDLFWVPDEEPEDYSEEVRG